MRIAEPSKLRQTCSERRRKKIQNQVRKVGLIQELWGKLREYEDRLAASSRNSSQPPSQDSAAGRAERKKLKRLVAEIRQALGLDTPDIDDA